MPKAEAAKMIYTERNCKMQRNDAVFHTGSSRLCFRDYVCDHRFPKNDLFHSKKQKEKQLRGWERNAGMLEEYREGSSVLNISKKYGLSRQRTYIILKREECLQSVLSSIPKKKVVMLDFGPFRWRTESCLENENLLHLPIEEFYQSQNARSLLRIPNFGRKSLHEITLCLKEEGYDIAKFILP